MLTRVLRTVPLDTIDRRSKVGVALRRIRDDLTDQLGGDVTPAEKILIEEIAKARVIAAAVGDYILKQDTLVKKGSLLPVVAQHTALTGNLTRMLTTLGLERRAKQVSIVEQLAALHHTPAPVEQSGDRGTTGQCDEAVRPAGPRVGEPDKQEP